MKIMGVEKSSFIDYPGKICTVLFTGLCNFKCGYCHNSSVVKGLEKEINKEEVFAFLEKRKRFVDAVCISGGEPTIHEGLYDFIKEIKNREFFIKLDTNGTNPEVLKKLIDHELIDYVAMDIKSPLGKYKIVTGVQLDVEDIRLSIDIIRNKAIDYEFRTTVCQELLTKDDILEIAEYLKGSKKYYIQNFKDGANVLAGEKQFRPYNQETLEEIKKNIEGYFDIFEIRK